MRRDLDRYDLHRIVSTDGKWSLGRTGNNGVKVGNSNKFAVDNWIICKLDDGSVNIRVPRNGLGDYLSCSADGKVVDIYFQDDGSGRQRWTLWDDGSGKYRICTAADVPGKHLALESAGETVRLGNGNRWEIQPYGEMVISRLG